MIEDGFDLARRELCPDDACIGLIGHDGRCKECGQVAPSAVADPRHQGMARARIGEADAEEEAEAGSLGDDDYRTLCPDETCVGILGADGRCKECGTEGPAPGAKASSEASTAASSPDRPAMAPAEAPREEPEPARKAEAEAAPLEEAPDDLESRNLCPDGACIGVIGPDWKCKVCGTLATTTSP